jgi:hypothetical protein
MVCLLLIVLYDIGRRDENVGPLGPELQELRCMTVADARAEANVPDGFPIVVGDGKLTGSVLDDPARPVEDDWIVVEQFPPPGVPADFGSRELNLGAVPAEEASQFPFTC